MLIKAAILFVLVMVGLAFFGRLRLPGRKAPPLLRKSCPRCGRPRIGAGPCPCGKG
ncbi:hypothetical protein ACTTAL_02055 [Rhodobacter capsulatus]|uniref:hypothetical protein n=1 Tax=Rhodobacter capsulatus TaxID=1061 RepID=UPI0003D391E5|nr:hypothetical protein [Rhodobacter capsulatus]ETD82565.1 short-chain dehydrogenase [Rhodobacter capsulatus B6]ETD88298.1 short-chain dehydrogenase [Rhodobacter capsulatus YW2]